MGLKYGVGVDDFYQVHNTSAYEKVKGRVKKVDRRMTLWLAMLSRCYSDYTKKVRPTYVGVECCEEWKTYSLFHKDVSCMVGFDHLEDGWVLDKDILVKGGKFYSKDTCCIVLLR